MRAKLILTFSALLLAGAFAHALDAETWISRLQKPGDSKSIEREMQALRSAAHSERLFDLEKIASQNNSRQAILYLRAYKQLGTAHDGPSVKKSVGDLPFKDSDEKKTNWLSRAMERIDKETPPDEPQAREPDSQPLKEPPAIDVRPLAWAIVIVGVGIVAYFGLRYLENRAKGGTGQRKKGRKRGLLNEDEEVGEYEDWLRKAQLSETNGDYREAIRCLFIAMLLRLDSARVVAFDRYQTNWEHLARIEDSGAPPEVAYRDSTKLFDATHYGDFQPSITECKFMRSQFDLLHSALREAKS